MHTKLFRVDRKRRWHRGLRPMRRNPHCYRFWQSSALPALPFLRCPFAEFQKAWLHSPFRTVPAKGGIRLNYGKTTSLYYLYFSPGLEHCNIRMCSCGYHLARATWAIRYETQPSCHRKPRRWFISLGMMLATVILDAAYCLCVRELLIITV